MEIQDLPKDKKIILFDGVCNLCDASIQYIIKHDNADVFRVTIVEEIRVVKKEKKIKANKRNNKRSST